MDELNELIGMTAEGLGRLSPQKMPELADKNALLRVGDGRGFVIEIESHGRLVVTAAHCLPRTPDPHPWTSGEHP
jgi:hypothetical protein